LRNGTEIWNGLGWLQITSIPARSGPTFPFAAALELTNIMAITDKTRKLLWGPSGNRCAFCRTELIMEKTPLDDESVVGDEAHIHSEKEDGPRFDPSFPKERIDLYENLLLLCKIHHKLVDDQAETFTADILRALKSNHELWVRSALAAAEDPAALKPSSSRAIDFQRVEAQIPELIAELRADVDAKPFIREFVLLSRKWTYNGDERDPVSVYFFEDHDNLQGKIQILENRGLIIDVTFTTVKRYRMAEDFVDLLST
jgi:HNH endonuclease